MYNLPLLRRPPAPGCLVLSNHPQQSPRSPPCTRQSSWSSRPRARPRLCHGTGDRLTGSAGSEVARGGQRKEVSHVILQDHCILHDLHFTVATFSLYFLRERASEREQTQVLELSKSRTPLRRVGRVSHVDGGQSEDLTLGPKRGERSSAGGLGSGGKGGAKKNSQLDSDRLPSLAERAVEGCGDLLLFLLLRRRSRGLPLPHGGSLAPALAIEAAQFSWLAPICPIWVSNFFFFRGETHFMMLLAMVLLCRRI